ncbi:prismalin-14-like [Lingula anatina]|uniref:Prismalin-14-like n=1 Tax=Lingula anatina TaxID=7574 RepID=A0A1S3J1S4_LINAN|nr:prismalin-14-like [Lingula anatina]XP_013412963.1 prismalin-14-like [Lingula anatina]|eukprot:XP_013404387.1 prismalin-14-like [Lingula anatina]
MMLKAVVLLAIVAFAAAVPGTKYYPAPDGSGRILYFPNGYVSGNYAGGIPVSGYGALPASRPVVAPRRSYVRPSYSGYGYGRRSYGYRRGGLYGLYGRRSYGGYY